MADNLESAATQTEQLETPPPSGQVPPTATPSTGPGQIFRHITHTLTDDDLKNPAVVKLIIDRMYTSELQRDDFRQYVKLYHAADKDAGILKEKLKINIAGEITFGVGLTMGGAAIGLAPYFWAKDQDHLAGMICIGAAVVLTVGSIVARAFYGSRQ